MDDVQRFITKGVVFLGEQDGVPERELKSKLYDCFAMVSEVELAYLVRVSFSENPGAQVALCVKGRIASPDDLLECSGKIFSELFSATQHLDILLLSDQQADEIACVAKPFYSNSFA